MQVGTTSNYCIEALNPDGLTASLRDASWVREDFSWNGSSGVPVAPYFTDRLTAKQVNGQPGYMVRRETEGKFYLFDGSGSLANVTEASGATLGLSYSTASTPSSIAPGVGYMIAQTDAYGRKLQFFYGSDGSLASVLDPAGQSISYQYAAVRQATSIPSARAAKPSVVTFQDGKTKTYLWDEPAWSTGTDLGTDRLTGILDELNVRYASFGYKDGKAISTEHAGTADRFSLVDQRSQGAGTIALTTPSGATYNQSYSLVNGLSRMTSQTQPPGAGCLASTSARGYDGNGNVASSDDFDGHRSCYVSDLSRNVETTRVEGLSNTVGCGSVTTANVALPAGSRKVSTVWHPDWRLEAKVAEPGRLTTSVYNGQPDPFNGNATATCAPTTALLPDGKPIAVLCKRVEQATSDTDGHLGLGAALQAGVANRIQQWTYNQYGQVLTAKGPRTDVNDTTTYTYYTDTVFTGADPNATGHTVGDLKTVKNALNKTTTFDSYDKHGQLLQSTDANGVVTLNTYDLRQRLLSTSVGGQATTYSYYPTGLLKRITQPDNVSWIGYDYDDAHRKKAVYDNLGNRIDYTLDNAGNIKLEETKDPGGLLARTLSRSIDTLGRVQQITGRE